MELEIWGKLLLILLLVAGNAFFVGSEIALTSARRSRIKLLANTGNSSAKIVQLLHDEPERFYSVTQIGITLVSLALGAIGMVTISDLVDPMFESMFSILGDSEGLINAAHTTSYIFAFIVISFLHVVAGELAPKVLAFHKAEQLSLSVAWIINFMYKAARPIIWVMNHSSNGLLWLFGQRDLSSHSEGHFSMSGEEIRTVLTASEKEGILGPHLTKMVTGIFNLDEGTAGDSMIPRMNVLALQKESKVEDVLKLFKYSNHARYPVYDKTLDHIIGLVSMKELVENIAAGKDIADKSVMDFLHPCYFIPKTKSLSFLLQEFISEHYQMAIVIDEFGGTSGIITLDDILEEIVGDFSDEFTSRHIYVGEEGPDRYIVDAQVRINDLETVVDYPFAPGDYITLAGLICKKLDRIPKEGDVIEMEGARLTIIEMVDVRIVRVLFEMVKADEDEEEDGKAGKGAGKDE